MQNVSQRGRLAAVIVYVMGLFLTSKVALGSWLPPASAKGLWFYSGLASILLGNLLVTPFFTKPVDAISSSVAGVGALLGVNLWKLGGYTAFDRLLWTATVAYLVFVLLSALVEVVLKDVPRTWCQRLSRSLYLICDSFGSAKWLFSVVFLFALVVFHRSSPREVLIIALAWALFVGLQPLESIFRLGAQLCAIWASQKLGAELVGEVVGHQSPGIVLVRHQHRNRLSLGDLLVVRAEDGRPGLALALDHVGYSDGLWLRALHLPVSNDLREHLAGIAPTTATALALAVSPDHQVLGGIQASAAAWERRARLVGLVSPDTDLLRLRIEVIRTDLDLEEGLLVEVSIGSKPVLYQIINGLTREEILQQKNTRGFIRAEARKIGYWDADMGGFETVNWLPAPNSPVFLLEPGVAPVDGSAVGHFPGTGYPVRIDPHSLVTHNGAILGILGVGKSFLAIELVERMIESDIKVICLDLTNQYARELAPFAPSAEDRAQCVAELNAIGREGKGKSLPNAEEAGSVRQFRERVRQILTVFLDRTTGDHLRVFNPAEFEVWRQDGKIFAGVAPMATLTPAEITRVFAEITLEILQGQGMTDSARCCLVFEEAHSLIPEWTAVASEGDKSATNGTAKAILQGRKYGLGCLVVTQRTANVTKSILNQCNTIFALRLYDDTGKDFLGNYIGRDYSGILSALKDRHAIVFGKASSCREPVLVRLNDRADFLRAFREVQGTAGDTEATV